MFTNNKIHLTLMLVQRTVWNASVINRIYRIYFTILNSIEKVYSVEIKTIGELILNP